MVWSDSGQGCQAVLMPRAARVNEQEVGDEQ